MMGGQWSEPGPGIKTGVPTAENISEGAKVRLGLGSTDIREDVAAQREIEAQAEAELRAEAMMASHRTSDEYSRVEAAADFLGIDLTLDQTDACVRILLGQDVHWPRRSGRKAIQRVVEAAHARIKAEQDRRHVDRGPLTFDRLRNLNTKRQGEIMGPDGAGWTGADWANAMQAEAGEAGNVVKKLRRIETGAADLNRGMGEEALREKLTKEIGDTLVYLDLLADHYNLLLEDCVRFAFNEVSDRVGFEEEL